MHASSGRTTGSLRRPGRPLPWKLSKRHFLWLGLGVFVLVGMIELALLQSHHERKNQDDSRTLSQKQQQQNKPLSPPKNPSQQLQQPTDVKPQIQKVPTTSQAKTTEKMAEPQAVKTGFTEAKAAPNQKHLAIVIPFRESNDLRSQGTDREKNLRQWLDYMSEFLRPDLIAVTTIYVIEQAQEGIFNKGFLLNAGFDYIMKKSSNRVPDYLIFHDVDQIPRKTCGNCYDFRSSPTKLIRETTRREGNKNVKRKLSPSNVGGAFMITPEIYRKVNGYSNILAGWGIEDDNMGYRIKRFNGGFRVHSPGAFTGLPHARVPGLDTTEQFKKNSENIHETDTGLSDLHYEVSGETDALVKRLNVVRIVVEPVEG